MSGKKKVSEMNYLEKFEQFKLGILELVETNFNGNKLEELEPVVFLGVKSEVITYLIKNKPEGMHLSGDMENLEENKEKICILPIFIGKELSAGNHMESLLGPQALSIAKKIANDKITNAIDHFNSVISNAVQFSAHVCEAYILEQKYTEQEGSKMALGIQPESIKNIEKFIDENGSVGNHPNAEEKVIIIFENIQYSQLVKYDMMRSEDSQYQELTNKFVHEPSYEPASGHLASFIHKHKNVN